MFAIHTMPNALKKLCEIETLFDFYRIVDPATQEVYEYASEEMLIRQSSPCYALWQRGESCRNCVSQQTILDQQGQIKFEAQPDHAYLIYALPLIHQHKKYVLELAKDVSESLMLQLLLREEQADLPEMIAALNEWIIHDTFTGLYNKKYLQQETARLISYAQVKQLPLSAAMWDIDTFKQVNDRYGHLAGDEVIKKFAHLLQDFIRDTPYLAARVGGDEFMLLCPDEDAAGCERLCRRVSAALAAHPFVCERGVRFLVSASYGVSNWEKGESVSALFEKADRKMYAHKRRKKEQMPSLGENR